MHVLFFFFFFVWQLSCIETSAFSLSRSDWVQSPAASQYRSGNTHFRFRGGEEGGGDRLYCERTSFHFLIRYAVGEQTKTARASSGVSQVCQCYTGRLLLLRKGDEQCRYGLTLRGEWKPIDLFSVAVIFAASRHSRQPTAVIISCCCCCPMALHSIIPH